MPLPRRQDADFARVHNGRPGLGSVVTEPRSYGRPPTNTEAKRRWRAGNGPGRTGGTRFVPVWDAAPPNGLPGPCYVYRGTGADQFTGEVVV